jgi:hypothetical protein
MRPIPNFQRVSLVDSIGSDNEVNEGISDCESSSELLESDVFDGTFRSRVLEKMNPLFSAFSSMPPGRSLSRTMSGQYVNVEEVKTALQYMAPRIASGAFNINAPFPDSFVTMFPGQLPLGVAASLANDKLYTLLRGVEGIDPCARDGEGYSVLMRAVTGAIVFNDATVLKKLLSEPEVHKTLNEQALTAKGPRENAIDLALHELLRDKESLFTLDLVKFLKEKGGSPILYKDDAVFWRGELRKVVDNYQRAMDILDFKKPATPGGGRR